METLSKNRFYLDGRLTSNLDWSATLDDAVPDEQITWKLDLGLVDHLTHPLHHEQQFLALGLAIDHFTETAYALFPDTTQEVILYQGKALIDLSWDETQESHYQAWLEHYGNSDLHAKSLYCIDALAEYLDLLIGRLPDDVTPLAIFDVTEVNDPVLEAQLLSKERFERIELVVEGGTLPHSTPLKKEKHAVCLPDASRSWHPFHDDFERLFADLQVPYRLIPEAFVTIEWEGLDVIYYHPKSLSQFGERKLQGFEAAGGQCLSIR